MKIGVGVEGPSDLQFWNKLLHKHFRSCRFDVRNMKNRDKLIRESPRLLETFMDLHYDAGFILVDLDDEQCVSAVLELFCESVRQKAQLPKKDRFLHVCVAKKNLESWYLADPDAINAVVPGCLYSAPTETSHLGKGKLRELLVSQLGRGAGFNEIAFAKGIAPKFSPQRALSHSSSFSYFWDVIESRIRRPVSRT